MVQISPYEQKGHKNYDDDTIIVFICIQIIKMLQYIEQNEYVPIHAIEWLTTKCSYDSGLWLLNAQWPII